jgi:hypothetical protein
MRANINLQSNWIIREYTPEDKIGVFNLRKSVYGSAFDEVEWKWKYTTDSKARQSRIFVVESQGMIIGLRSIIILRARMNDQNFLTGMSMDAMIHPGFRGRGIYTELLVESVNRVREQNISLILSFPNERSYPSLMRNSIKWHHICSVPLLVKPLDYAGLTRKYVNFSPLQLPVRLCGKLLFNILAHDKYSRKQNTEYTINKLVTFDDRFDNLWQKSLFLDKISIIRDSQYLQWRYCENPVNKYVIYSAEKGHELKGFIVLKTVDNMFGLKLGLIADVVTLDNKQIANSLLSRAVTHFTQEKVGAIGCLMLKNIAYYRVLRDHGFIHLPELLSPKEFYFMVNTSLANNIYDIVYDKNNWFLSFGDIDII